MQPSCPTADRLRRFLEGAVSEAESIQIADHVDGCANCDCAVSALERQERAVSEQLREGLHAARLLDEPEFQELRRTACSPNVNTTSTSCLSDDHASGGKRLRDYRLVKKIGEGGMGTVYQAVHIHLGKAVAVKILPADKLRSKQSVARFQQEMRSVGKVNHTNVVGASDAGNVDGLHFLVMELVEGADLARIIRDQGPLEIADACEIVRQAALGLQHAHDNGLVHRDIKPSNLMLTVHGSVKVLDLGLAALNNTTIQPDSNAEFSDRLTSVGQIVGTLDYMAPEQIVATTQVDQRADIYALGATLFQLLTGRTPCGDRSAEIPDRIEAVLHKPPLDAVEVRDDVPTELGELLRKMLAKPPQDRPPTAEDVAEALTAFVGQAGLSKLAEKCRTSLDIPSADIDVTNDVSLIVSPTKTREIGKLAKRPGRSWSRGALLALLVALLFAAGVSSIFVFRTPHGTVKVEMPEAAKRTGLRVALEEDGETVCIADETRGWEVRVAAGKYDVRPLPGDKQFELSHNAIEVKSGKSTVVRVTLQPPSGVEPSPESLILKDYDRAVELAELAVTREPEQGWNHGRAAMIWGLQVSRKGEKHRLNYERHRDWLVKRWGETGEGTNTIPRICCVYPDAPADLQAMLTAVTREAKQHRKDWRYPHSRMMLLYRLERYEEALLAFQECRKVSPSNKTHVALDHAWFALILCRLERYAEGRKDQEKALALYHELRPRSKEMPAQWFDFIELHITLCEAAMAEWQDEVPTEGTELSIPLSLCTNDVRLLKWHRSSDSISGVALSEDGTTAILGVGWRPGTWEWWRLDHMDPSKLLIDRQHITRRQGGQPIRSVAVHPSKKFAALGRWYGAVDIVDLEKNEIRATRETSVGKVRKANSVTFVTDGRHLLIGYQSNRLVDWNWLEDKVVQQQAFPRPVWGVFVASNGNTIDGNVLVHGQLWNRETGETKEIFEGQVRTGWLSQDSEIAIVSTGRELHTLDLQNDKTLIVTPFESDVGSIVPLIGSHRAITGHDNGEIRLLDYLTGENMVLARLHCNHGAGYLGIDTKNRILLAATDKLIDRSRPKDHQIAVWALSDRLQEESMENLRQQADQSEQWHARVKQQIEDELAAKPETN